LRCVTLSLWLKRNITVAHRCRDVPRRALLEAEVGQLRARLALLERKIASL
jgi:hypothetical protein